MTIIDGLPWMIFGVMIQVLLVVSFAYVGYCLGKDAGRREGAKIVMDKLAEKTKARRSRDD